MSFAPSVLYCDHHATTFPSERVRAAMLRILEGCGNAASAHLYGRAARDAVEGARRAVADLLDVEDPSTIVFTSGATESNNLALQGVVDAARRDGILRPHVLASALEHSSVLGPLRAMHADGRCELDEVPAGPDGLVRVEDVAARLRTRTDVAEGRAAAPTVLVSMQGANNEIGTIQPVHAVGDLCAQEGVLFHTDLAQSAGKVPFDAGRVDLATLSAHKLCGPQGVGALYGRAAVLDWLRPPTAGGTHERGLRPGTQNVPGIVGFGVACREMMRTWNTPHDGQPPEAERLRGLRDLLRALLYAHLGEARVVVQGAIEPPCWEAGYETRVRLPQNLNVRFPGVCPKWLHAFLRPRVALSAASACKALGGERSHVLQAIGAPDDGAVVRIGLGACNDEAQVRAVAAALVEGVRAAPAPGAAYARCAAA